MRGRGSVREIHPSLHDRRVFACHHGHGECGSTLCLYSAGDLPVHILNALSNVLKLLNPTRRHTSVTGESPVRSHFLAANTLSSETQSLNAMPTLSRKNLGKWVRSRPAMDAARESDMGSAMWLRRCRRTPASALWSSNERQSINDRFISGLSTGSCRVPPLAAFSLHVPRHPNWSQLRKCRGRAGGAQCDTRHRSRKMTKAAGDHVRHRGRGFITVLSPPRSASTTLVRRGSHSLGYRRGCHLKRASPAALASRRGYHQ